MKKYSLTQQLRKVFGRTSSRSRQRFLASLAAAGAVGGGSVAYGDTTTTLTGLGNTNMDVPVNHGSNAEATLTWDTNWDQYADWDGRGDVYQIDQRIAEVTFAPTSALIKLTIQDFFLDEWAGGTDTSAMWSVTGSSSGLLASGNWTDKNNANDPNDLGGRTLVSVNATGVPGETLALVFDHTLSGGYISYLAMDNLTFLSMVVPEPATAVMAWLGVGGLGAMAMRRKRQ
jgi:hypothetical protein